MMMVARCKALAAVLGVVLLAMSKMETAVGMQVADHCNAACVNLIEPQDDETRKNLNMEVVKACQSAFARSNYDGKICRQSFLATGKISCKLGCEHMISGNVISSKAEMANQRKTCEKFASGHYGPSVKSSCDQGIKTATRHFDKHGLALRAKIDEMCASESEDSGDGVMEAAEEEPAAPIKPVRVAVKQPVVDEKRPVAEEKQPEEPQVEMMPEIEAEVAAEVEALLEASAVEEEDADASPIVARKLRISPVEVEV